MIVPRLVLGLACLSALVQGNALNPDTDFLADDDTFFAEEDHTEEESQEDGMTFAELENQKNDINKLLTSMQRQVETKLTNDGVKVAHPLPPLPKKDAKKTHAVHSTKVVVHDKAHEIVIPIKQAAKPASAVAKHIKKVTAKHAKHATHAVHAAHKAAAVANKALAKAKAVAKAAHTPAKKAAAELAVKKAAAEAAAAHKKATELAAAHKAAEDKKAAAHKLAAAMAKATKKAGLTSHTHSESASVSVSVSATMSVSVHKAVPVDKKEVFPKTNGTVQEPTPNAHPGEFLIPEKQLTPKDKVQVQPGKFEYDAAEMAVKKAMEAAEGIKAAKKAAKAAKKAVEKHPRAIPQKHLETHPTKHAKAAQALPHAHHKADANAVHKIEEKEITKDLKVAEAKAEAEQKHKKILHTAGGEAEQKHKKIFHTAGGVQSKASIAHAATNVKIPAVTVHSDSGKATPSVPVKVWNAANSDLSKAIKNMEKSSASAYSPVLSAFVAVCFAALALVW